MREIFWKEKLKKVPDKPGVYIFYNELKEVIYVGKATSLKERMRSYTSDSGVIFPKDRLLREHIHDFDFIVTSSPSEALILEANLIKKYKPRFNVRLKDDKSYPYLKIVKDDFPYVVITRKLKDDGSIYFGPYTNVKALRRVLRLSRKLFPLRRCKGKLPKKKCIYYDVGECAGPCIGKVDKEEYQRIVKDFIYFIQGRVGKLKRSLEKEMKTYAKRLEFEKAAIIRDRISSIEKVFYTQRVLTDKNISFDVVFLFSRDEKPIIEYMEVREGRLTFEKAFEMSGNPEREDTVSSFISLIYSKKITSPSEIITNVNLQGRKELEAFLEEKFGHKVSIKVPKRGFKRKILSLAEENAEEHWKEIFIPTEKEVLLKVKELLNLNKIPEYIEGYDISNISGMDAVGSLVVFHMGRRKKEYYRRFKIKFTKGPDDYAMMMEVLKRRFLHKEDKKFPWKPDLILIDGGKGQLSVALKVKRALNLPFKFISIAKKEEILFYEDFSDPIILPKDSKILHLFQRVRDEAHRFAKSYFELLHTKKQMKKST